MLKKLETFNVDEPLKTEIETKIKNQRGGASSIGQEQKDEDNSAAYGAIAIGLIIGLFTGFKV